MHFFSAGGAGRIRTRRRPTWLELSAHRCGPDMHSGLGLSALERYRDFTCADKAVFIDKVRSLAAVGIDDLAILFDDIRGDVPDLAAREAEIEHTALVHARDPRVHVPDLLLRRPHARCRVR